MKRTPRRPGRHQLSPGERDVLDHLRALARDGEVCMELRTFIWFTRQHLDDGTSVRDHLAALDERGKVAVYIASGDRACVVLGRREPRAA